MIEIKPLPPPEDKQAVQRALISVFDKRGIVEFGRGLQELGIEILSTGGTARALSEAGIPVIEVSELTAYPEIFGGRVKTLHPVIHGGILARRNDPEDLGEMSSHGIPVIDMVVTNLYPFAEAIAGRDATDAVAVENIDIGGPAMIRAAAKNFFFVAVVTDPADYDPILSELRSAGGRLSMGTRRRLATDAFERTADYDRRIADYFAGDASGAALGSQFSISLPQAQALRYGENPHQEAGLYGDPSRHFEQLHGKELSFNNLLDLTAALSLIGEFESGEPACAILKHTNPCGVGIGSSLSQAYRSAFATDRQSPFGGIVVVNRELDEEAARLIDQVFTEIIIAPAFSEDALEFLRKKKNRRLIRSLPRHAGDAAIDVRSAAGGVLVQQVDGALPDARTLRSESRVVTRRPPAEAEWRDLDFAWRVVKHVKSNAIVYARDGATLGIGAGQMSRIDSSEIAVMKAGKSGLDLRHSVVASDAFFPFPDGLLAAARSGARAVIQPGGSVRDDEVIRAADDHDVAMVFTGKRHFRH